MTLRYSNKSLDKKYMYNIKHIWLSKALITDAPLAAVEPHINYEC